MPNSFNVFYLCRFDDFRVLDPNPQGAKFEL